MTTSSISARSTLATGINKDMPNDVAHRLAKALNESSAYHWASEDIFYSTRHAPNTFAPLHPGAARYYRELGVLAET